MTTNVKKFNKETGQGKKGGCWRFWIFFTGRIEIYLPSRRNWFCSA
jgi:hypothetical protein